MARIIGKNANPTPTENMALAFVRQMMKGDRGPAIIEHAIVVTLVLTLSVPAIIAIGFYTSDALGCVAQAISGELNGREC